MTTPAATTDRRPNAALGVYLRVVAALGAAVLIQSSFVLLKTPLVAQWMLFGALAVIAGSFNIGVASAKVSVSVADTFFISSALLFGPAPATLAVAIDSFLVTWRKGHPWRRLVFNTAAPAMSIWCGGHAFFLVFRTQPLAFTTVPASPVIAPLIGFAAVYYFVNSGLTAVAIGLESGRSPFDIWRRHFSWLWVGYLASASLAFCLVVLVQQVGIAAVVIVLPVLAVFQITMRATFGRLDDAEQHGREMNRLYRSTIETLAMAIDAKDDVTHNHLRRVQTYAVALARALGLQDENMLKALEAAALLHDTGKLAVPEHILNKPGPLTPAEFEQMKRHVDVGADILSLVDFPYDVVPIVRCHHESWDGTGYPAGLKGVDIPMGARILSVVDCFDALISDRPYRKRLSDEQALDILRQRRGKMYDPVVVDTFIRIYRDIALPDVQTPEHLDVMQQISRSSQQAVDLTSVPAAEDRPAASMSGDLLAFVSVARLASGAGTMADVLALSTGLVRQIVPDASGVWFVLNATGDRLVVADTFGGASPVIRRLTMRLGERLSGWVGANRQVIVNSDPALDLRELSAAIDPPLRSCLSVPLARGENLVGVLTLYAPEVNAFNDDQGRLMQMIAPQVADAIDLARRAAEEPDIRTSRDLKLVSTR